MPPPPGGFFKSSKGKTIALIVGGVAIIGILGGLGALLLGGDDKEPSAVDGPTPNSGSLSPSPVSTGSPQPSSPASSAPASPASPSAPASPTPPPSAPPQPSGSGVSLGDGVTIPLVGSWQEVDAQGDSSTLLSDGQGAYIFATVGATDPSTNAGEMVQKNFEVVVPADLYTDVRTSEVEMREAVGSVVSFAAIDYMATAVDQQGSREVYGRIYALVRQDGLGLLFAPEVSPPDAWESTGDSWVPMVDAIVNSFAGLG